MTVTQKIIKETV